ncbi:nucleobase-ascorbate transporter 4-like [Wolffia australiana]
MASKQDDFQPFPAKEQLPGVDYCINSPPRWAEAILLGFQHYVASLGSMVFIANILVHRMGGGREEKGKVIQTMVFVTGINTLLQINFGTRLPAVISSSRTFILPTLSIIYSQRYNDVFSPQERFNQTMRATQGALIIASSLQIAFGFLGVWGIVVRFLSPLAAVPLVTLAGLGLFCSGFPVAANCVEIGLPAIVLLVFLSQYAPNVIKSKRIIFERFSMAITVGIIWVYAFILTAAGAYKNRKPATQFSCGGHSAELISASPWIRIPYPLQWGRPIFNAGEGFAMMAASLVALVESTGALIAAQRLASSTPVPPSVFSRGVGWQGIGVLLDGLFGTGNGSATSVENVGLLGLTRVGSRRVVEISAGFMIFFSILGKFGAILASIPLPIFAALYCVQFAYVASAGLGLLQFCNLNSFRSKFILGFSFFLGLSVAQYFKEFFLIAGHGPVHSSSRAFNDTLNAVFSSAAMVAATAAFFLDCTLSRGDADAMKDSGRHWWRSFRTFSGDPRSEEFYSLPYNLSKYFPSY